LQQFSSLVFVWIEFAVLPPVPAHDLHIAISDDFCISHAVFVRQISFKWNGDVCCRVDVPKPIPAATVSSFNTQGTKLNSFWIVPACKIKL
jgi:hypothetical protein